MVICHKLQALKGKNFYFSEEKKNKKEKRKVKNSKFVEYPQKFVCFLLSRINFAWDRFAPRLDFEPNANDPNLMTLHLEI